MQEWNFQASWEGNEVLSKLNNLRAILEALRDVARELTPALRVGRIERTCAQAIIDVADQLGNGINLIINISDEIYAHVNALNHAVDRLQPQEDPLAYANSLSMSPRIFTASIFAGRKSIHLGFVNRYFVYPISPRLSHQLLHIASYVLARKIPNLNDLLHLEHHDVFGWHYHYCDRRMRRSDTLMSFDQARQGRVSPSSNQNLIPLCAEPHAVKKAHFKARPHEWQDRKRASIYEACAPDLKNSPALTFRRPSKEAQDVWPRVSATHHDPNAPDVSKPFRPRLP